MFLNKVRATIDSFGMLRPGEKIVAGVSGGSDSVALLFVLNELKPFYPGTDVVVCHINHGLRGRESDQDEQFVRDIASRLGFTFEYRRVDTQGFRKRNRLSLEDAARKLRYEIFSEVMKETSVQKIATAHTLDDQAETVLMRFLRGSGAQGLSGIKPSDKNLIRPLINVTKEEARQWLDSKGVAWREDSSNESNEFLRNRIRNELLPTLRTYNPAIERVLCRTAAVSAAQADFISQEAEKRMKTIVKFVAGGILGRTEALLLEPPAIRFSIMRKSIFAVKGDLYSISAGHLFSIDELIRSDRSSGEINLPGGIVFSSAYGFFFFARRQSFSPFLTEINGYGSTKVTEDLEVSVELTSDRSLWGRWDLGYFSSQKIRFPLSVRSFSDGDRFVPLGMRGQKKLKDFFIDEKVPRFIRKKVPVFETRDGIIWVGGLRTDERFKADSSITPWLRITISGSLRELLCFTK